MGGRFRGAAFAGAGESERGDQAEARRLWKMVLYACPGDAEAMARGGPAGSEALRGQTYRPCGVRLICYFLTLPDCRY